MGSYDGLSPPPASVDADAMARAEIAVLRGAVAALRATRASAVNAAHQDARVSATRRITASTLAAFALGIAVTLGLLMLYRAGFCE